jgi:hypothetical protein
MLRSKKYLSFRRERGNGSFVLPKPLSDWTMPAHIEEKSSPHSPPTHILISSEKTPFMILVCGGVKRGGGELPSTSIWPFLP